MLTDVGQTIPSKQEILFAQAVIDPAAARAGILDYREYSVRRIQQVESIAVGREEIAEWVHDAWRRERAVRRSGEQQLQPPPERGELRRGEQRVDHSLLPGSRLQHRRIGQDRRDG